MQSSKGNWRVGSVLAFSLFLASSQAGFPQQQEQEKQTQAQPASQPSPAKPTESAAKPPLSPEQRAWQVLSDAVKDRRSLHRQNAILAASTLPLWMRATRIVENGLHDKDADVRRVAATALGEMKFRHSIQLLQVALDDNSAAVRFAAAQSLWKMGDQSGRKVLLSILEGDASASSGALKEGLQGANNKLHDPNALALMGINEASGAFLGPFSMGIVMAEHLAKDKSAPGRVLSASLLASDHDPRSVRDLDEALGDSNWAVQAAAAKALAQHPCKQLIGDLEPLLDDKRDEVKLTAAASILRIAASTRSGPERNGECELLHHDAAGKPLQASADEKIPRKGPERK